MPRPKRNDPHINMAFYGEHLEFCREMAWKKHQSVTAFVNDLIAAEMAKHNKSRYKFGGLCMSAEIKERFEAVVKELLKNTDERFQDVLEFDVNHPRKADRWAHTCDADTIKVCQMIANDGFDITGFKLSQTPAPKVYCFYNPKTGQQFDVAQFDVEDVGSRENPQWTFAYVNNYVDKKLNYFPADTIQEAIEKFAV